MTFKTAMSTIGSGLLTTTAVIANAGIQTQIDEIDTELETLTKRMIELSEKKTDLEGRLITRY